MDNTLKQALSDILQYEKMSWSVQRNPHNEVLFDLKSNMEVVSDTGYETITLVVTIFKGYD